MTDGLGCIGLVLYAGKFATNLDLDIKRFKFLGDILHNVGVGVSILLFFSLCILFSFITD